MDENTGSEAFRRLRGLNHRGTRHPYRRGSYDRRMGSVNGFDPSVASGTQAARRSSDETVRSRRRDFPRHHPFHQYPAGRRPRASMDAPRTGSSLPPQAQPPARNPRGLINLRSRHGKSKRVRSSGSVAQERYNWRSIRDRLAKKKSLANRESEVDEESEGDEHEEEEGIIKGGSDQGGDQHEHPSSSTTLTSGHNKPTSRRRRRKKRKKRRKFPSLREELSDMGCLKVLLVDDSNTIASVASQWLKEFGFDPVNTASNGAEAYNLLEDEGLTFPDSSILLSEDDGVNKKKMVSPQDVVPSQEQEDGGEVVEQAEGDSREGGGGGDEANSHSSAESDESFYDGVYLFFLVDIEMPKVNGLQLLQRFSRDPYLKKVPVLLMSSTKDETQVDEGIRLGALDFLQKPLAKAALYHQVVCMLEKRAKSMEHASCVGKIRLERVRRDMLAQKNEEVMRRLRQMKQQSYSAVEIPMRIILDTVRKIMGRPDSPDEGNRQPLLDIVRRLCEEDLYKSILAGCLNADDGEMIDSATAEWLSEEFSGVALEDETPVDARHPTDPRKVTLEAVAEEAKVRREDQCKKRAEINEYQRAHGGKLPEGQSLPAKASQREGAPTGAMLDPTKFEFDSFAVGEAKLKSMVAEMFRTLRILDYMSISELQLRLFIDRLATEYQDVPYHTFLHALDVTQFCYATILSPGLSRQLSVFDAFCLLMAALAHDVGHPGTNNQFQINAETELAIVYNDRSPLENYHCSRLFTLLDSCKLLKHLPEELQNELRRVIIQLILSTDRSRHFEILSKLSSSGPEKKDASLDRMSLLIIILKCADLSFMTRPFRVGARWAFCLYQEFFMQGDLERELGLDVSPQMDRETVVIPVNVVKYINYISLPLFEAAATRIVSLHLLTKTLEETRQLWQKAARKIEEEKKKQKKIQKKKRRPAPVDHPCERRQSSAGSGDGAMERSLPDNMEPLIGDIGMSSLVNIKGVSILIVEPNMTYAACLVKDLSFNGYECVHAKTEMAAAEKLDTHDFEVLILSLSPFLDGSILLPRLSAINSKQEKHTTVIGITPYYNLHQKTYENLDKVYLLPIGKQEFLQCLRRHVSDGLRRSFLLDKRCATSLCECGPDFLGDLIREFAKSAQEELALAKAGVASQDFSVVQFNAHSMKGSAAQIGLKELSVFCAELEYSGKMKELARCKNVIEEVEQALGRVLELVRGLAEEGYSCLHLGGV